MGEVVEVGRAVKKLKVGDRVVVPCPIACGQCAACEALLEMTGGRGPDAAIDAVGLEANGQGAVAAYDRIKQAALLETDRPVALRQAIRCVRNGGVVSISSSTAGTGARRSC